MSNAFLRVLMAPWWLIQLLTGAKSFVDNPLIGSRRLNALGLHTTRVALAQRMTERRRARLAATVPPADRMAFDRDGVVVIRDFLSPEQFAALRDQVVVFEGEARETVQGDTITRRIAVDPVAISAIPAIRAFRANARWRSLARYIASFNVEPLLYIQAILTQRRDATPDPQINLHADTFYPAMKAWLFLEDVSEATGPFNYVLGSHRLTPERLAWERQRSLTVRDGDCRLSARGSFRVDAGELATLGLPQPTSFAVPANTLVVADTYGFHARGLSAGRSTRLELWAYGRRNPFRPLVGFDLWSLPGIAERRITLRWRVRDMIASVVGQPWVRAGRKRPGDE
ncbi:phytanoyl-CoA dioxygenase family protein [Sphingobium aromaticiconvertens]|uniref:phytanoyl-CoA dioxygenase family protein n=1 Tax=Sphingobium aromaticiconvertens TaxID=365341 RepID=UPI0030186F9B